MIGVPVPADCYEQGELPVISKGPTFENLLAEAFDQIRSYAKGNVAIMSRMLGAMQTLASLTDCPSRRQSLSEQVQWIAELAEYSLESTSDRAKITERLASVGEALEGWTVRCKSEGQDIKHAYRVQLSTSIIN